MAFPSLSFAVGLLVILYLLSFVLFAIIRIATGVSIQRLGYLSLRRIAYTPKDGVRIEIRGLGLALHRPTFARPTWLSLRLTDLKVTLDPFTAAAGKENGALGEQRRGSTGDNSPLDGDASKEATDGLADEELNEEPERSRTWQQLTQLKERIKALHGKIRWLRMIDIEVLNWCLVVTDIATIQLGSLTVAVDTRRRTVDRGRLFRHKKVGDTNQRPAEWIFVLKGVLFTAEGKDSLEVLDICSLNVHGFLVKDKAGLRDASVSLKLGRVHIPYDDILHCRDRIDGIRGGRFWESSYSHKRNISISDLMEELDDPGSREEQIVQTLSDSREFISSLLRGIQEIQLAVSFIGMSKKINHLRPSGRPMFLHSAMNEFGIDLFRLDPKSPAHRMYFSRDDIAHQALLAAISISVSIDDGVSKPERILYLPMATTTIKTTLPSKTVSGLASIDVSERNANVLFANMVITSPSVDIDLKHLPVVLALTRQHQDQDVRLQSSKVRRQRLMSRLWPKASIKFSVQEPVARVVLPLPNKMAEQDDDFDLLISSISSISLDLESSHSSSPDVQYAFSSNFRAASQQLYYQAASGERHSLLENESLELRTQVSATSELSVVMSANVDTLSMRLTRPEISKGLRQIMKQFHQLPHRRMSTSTPESRQFFVRRLPSWLVLSQIRGTNFSFEIAGVDPGISPDTRGLAFQLESWSVDYKHQGNATLTKYRHLHRRLSKSIKDDTLPQTIHARRAKKQGHANDGRKLQFQIQNFQGFIVEGIEKWEQQPFISLPKGDVSMSTSSDSHGPVSNIDTHVSAVLMQYSLYRYYAFGVARNVFRRAFALDSAKATASQGDDEQQPASPMPVGGPPTTEAKNIDLKVDFLQLKAHMPSDPPLLLQIYSSELGRHRWSTPFFRSKVLRLCAEAPGIKAAWARILSIKNLRADLRESRRRIGKEHVKDQLIDVSSELARIGVPHQLVVHRVFDNFVNVFKATQQLQHRFDHGNDEYVLKKGPEGPRKLPKISYRTRTLMVELEDSPFEWRLGLIYRVGLNEQKQRLTREEAYRLKLKRLDEETQIRRSSQLRNAGRSRTRHSKSRVSTDEPRVRRTPTFDSRFRRRSSSHSENRGRQMRYNAETTDGLTHNAKISKEEAWLRLQEHNAASWRRRITTAMKYHSDTTSDIRSMFMGTEDVAHHDQDKETMVEMPSRPGLMSAIISDLHIVVDKPSFAPSELPSFLHSVGKGMPSDMQYSLLIPMSLQVNMGEARVNLRNYPLPLLHVPALRPGQSSRLPSWSLRTDFVVAEEFRNEESMRQVVVEVIPSDKFIQLPDKRNGFFVDVRRTVAPVKTYSDVEVSINTSDATSITWGTSYQPAIQDMMQVIENFTKPQLDPSERVGFWDKIRLIFHSRLRVTWRGDGDVHLKLKGSRDPYMVTGHGAGFVMCFRHDVRWDIHQDDDPKKFMTVSCGDYVLAIPDYSSQARALGRSDSASSSERSSSLQAQKNNALFQKVIMKLSGDVRWLAGLVFERELESGSRSFEFRPHYDVTLKTPKYAHATGNKTYDAFQGFRSHHIHLSLAVIAPVDRDWSVTNSTPSSSYNSIHMSPRFFTHFFDWWSLFSGVMALPIRQGKLFPGREKSNKKFGRHLATIKYNLLLSPFYIAHIYKHKDIEDYAKDSVGATGLKLRIDSFMLDLHQRREEFTSHGKDSVKPVKTSGMRINKAQLDFITTDLRAVSANITGTSLDDLKRATDADIASFQYQNVASPDLARFEIPDNDFMWIDMDDFVELDWILPAETHPQVRIMPLAYAPRFTYFRETDHGGVIHGDPGRSSYFGDEPTHFCIMTKENDPHRVQFDLVKDRLRVLDQQLETRNVLLQEAEDSLAQLGGIDPQRQEEIASIKDQIKTTEDRRRFMLSMLKSLSRDHFNSSPNPERDGVDSMSPPENSTQYDWSEQSNAEAALSDFNNRFIAHNVQLKWNNGLRNIILRYVHQVGQRRGFVYYMSRKAVKFILDILDEQSKKKTDDTTPQSEAGTGQSSPQIPKNPEEEPSLQERIKELLNDGRTTVDANDPNLASRPPNQFKSTNLQEDVSEDFVAQNSYHVRLIAPQIQLQSEKNAKSVLLVTGKEMELKVVQVMDRARMSDEVSGLVQRRFCLEMDGIQFFVTNSKTLQKYAHLYSANSYGAPKDTIWPPWLPLEVNFDFHVNPTGWNRVVQKTSASLRYDKYNTLRLKYNDEVSKGEKNQSAAPDDSESRLDHLWVDFPQIRAICDSAQYYTMYVIVLDLLLYSEPLEKSRSERLEKIMLAADFSDLTGAPEMVINLQERIRQLDEIKAYFQVHEKYLDRQGWHDRLSIESDLASCEDELFFIMKAITTSQQKVDDRTQKQTNGLLRWYLSATEIVWRLMRKTDEPLVEIQLQKAAYDRTDNSDGSNHNIMEIERIKGLNLLPDALYPEMIAPYYGGSHAPRDDQKAIKMFKVQWYMLEAIAGIPVLDQFEVNLFPLKLQLERETGKKLFEYIFPGNSENGSTSPFMVKSIGPSEDVDSDEERPRTSIPAINTPTQSDSQGSTRPGSIDLRLRPTFSLENGAPPAAMSSHRAKISGAVSILSQRSGSRTSMGSASVSQVSLASVHSSRENTKDDSSLPYPHGQETSKANSTANAERSKRFGLTRSTSKDEVPVKPSDDLTEMMSRASNYMTLAYVKIPSVVLCLSYKGRGERNLEDVHDFVFRMPTMEYRNKTWSNLDLALRLKRDVIKALISHTGAIIGNKFSHHRPNKAQQSRIREVVNSSSLLPNTNNLHNTLTRKVTALHRSSTAYESNSERGRPDSIVDRFSHSQSGSRGSGRHNVASPSANGSMPDTDGVSFSSERAESPSILADDDDPEKNSEGGPVGDVAEDQLSEDASSQRTPERSLKSSIRQKLRQQFSAR